MNSKIFLSGMGLGLMAGGAMGMMLSPRNRRSGKHMVSRCLKNVSEVIDDVSSVLK